MGGKTNNRTVICHGGGATPQGNYVNIQRNFLRRR
jgi:hypothetical protein